VLIPGGVGSGGFKLPQLREGREHFFLGLSCESCRHYRQSDTSRDDAFISKIQCRTRTRVKKRTLSPLKTTKVASSSIRGAGRMFVIKVKDNRVFPWQTLS